MAEYKVQFDVFEGPLDLLLYLIKKEEVDIYEVNLTKLATQFIAHIELMRMLDLDVAGEFVVMASTLMLIKSRELLPKDQQVQAEEEEELEDPRWELIRQLVEYKKFKDAAAQLQHREIDQENIFPRLPGKIDIVQQISSPKSEVSLFDLINAVNAVLKRVSEKASQVREIFEEQWTVSQKIEILIKLVADRVVKFSELFDDCKSRYEVVCTFLAVLELTRLKHVTCMQEEVFGEILVTKIDTEALESQTVIQNADFHPLAEVAVAPEAAPTADPTVAPIAAPIAPEVTLSPAEPPSNAPETPILDSQEPL